MAGNEFALDKPCHADALWAAPLRCLAALQGASDATVELGGWTRAACAAVLSAMCTRLADTDTDTGTDRATKLLCAAVLVGPLTRIAVAECGRRFPWYWQSLFHNPTTGLFSDREEAVAFVARHSGLEPHRAAGVVALCLEAARHGAVAVCASPKPPSPPGVDAQAVWQCLVSVEARFGHLRAARWCACTKTPLRGWSQTANPPDGKGLSSRCEPLSLLSIVPWLVWAWQDDPAKAGSLKQWLFTPQDDVAASARWAGLTESLPVAVADAVGPFPREWAVSVDGKA